MLNLPSTKTWTIVLAAATLSTARSPAHAVVKKKAPSSHAAAGAATSTVPPLTVNNDPFIAKLKPLPSGPGMIVGEPSSAPNTDASVGALGLGCARWLHYTLASQPEIGKSPLLPDIYRAASELSRPDARFTVHDVPSLYSKVGVTHVAVGQISGTPTACKLTYQVYVSPGLTKVGAPIVTAGTSEQIVAGLPETARQLCARMAVSAPGLPSEVGATRQELETIGGVRWTKGEISAAPLNPELDALADRIPVAAVWRIASDSIRGNGYHVTAAVKSLIESQPTNPEVAGEIGAAGSYLGPYQDIVTAQLGKYPNNFLTAVAAERQQRALRNYDREVEAARHAAQCNGLSPTVWLNLYSAYGASANGLRQGRTAVQITDKEWDTLNDRYVRGMWAVARAVVLDGSYGRAWASLSTGATLAHSYGLADRAFWMSAKLDTADKVLVYFWGLQMYQKKWIGKPASLAKVAQMAIDDRYATPGDAIKVSQFVKEIGMNDAADKMVSDQRTLLEAAIAKDPKDALAHLDLAAAKEAQNDNDGAFEEAQTYIKLKQFSVAGYLFRARLFRKIGNVDRAKEEYGAALSLEPWNIEAQTESESL